MVSRHVELLITLPLTNKFKLLTSSDQVIKTVHLLHLINSIWFKLIQNTQDLFMMAFFSHDTLYFSDLDSFLIQNVGQSDPDEIKQKM